MHEVIHDDEVDTSEPIARSLLAEQCPQWADAPLSYLPSSGTTNALWRIRSSGGNDHVMRLPRKRDAEASIDCECSLLAPLASSELAKRVEIPRLAHAGTPGERFPMRWMVASWIDGDDAWEARAALGRSATAFADDLVAAVHAISELDGLPAPDRRPGERGGPLPALLDRLERMLADPRWSAPELIDVAAVRRSAAASAEVAEGEVITGFVHGDLIPGNLLTVDGRLRAVIDWGGAGFGDPAQDLAPAWALLDEPARTRFRSALAIDDATWLRARAFELEHAVGAVLYYRPRGHQLAEVMARTLDRVLTDSR